MFAAVLKPGRGEDVGAGRSFKILEDAIREAQRNGEVRQGDPELLGRVVWALVHGASMLRLGGANAEVPFIRFSTEILRSGLSKQ